jgi:carboxyl-terminal processing protease
MTRAAGAIALAGMFLTVIPMPAALTPQQRQLSLQSFEYVWTAIRDKHWETKPGGLDWQAIHDEFKPQIEAADSMEAVRAAMSQMLARLHQTHFGIVPADLYSNVDATHSSDVSAGIDVRVIGAQVLVTSVEPGSSAAAQGVRPGWEILKIAGADLAPVVTQLNETYAGSTLRDLMLRRTILGRLDSGSNESIAVELLDGAGQHVSKALARANPKGEVVQFGYLTPMHVWFTSSQIGDGRAGGGIGYVAFNAFLDPARLMTSFGDSVASCHTCDGFIVDLRGNPGGIGIMAMGMAGWFIAQADQKLGTLYTRDNALKFVVNPRLTTFSGPLAILVDGASASTSEIMAQGLKDLRRARIFGTHTAGAALPSMFEKLPNGDGFQYAIANYISEGGQPLEGLGVTPDVETPITREALLAGKDPALDAAVVWIKQQGSAK